MAAAGRWITYALFNTDEDVRPGAGLGPRTVHSVCLHIHTLVARRWCARKSAVELMPSIDLVYTVCVGGGVGRAWVRGECWYVVSHSLPSMSRSLLY